MTSNIGSDLITNYGMSRENINTGIQALLKQHFRPEFLNRIDDIVIFNFLDIDQIMKIVDIQINRLNLILRERKIMVSLDESARKALADAGFDPDYGARPLKRAIQKSIQDRLAIEILKGSIVSGDHLNVSWSESGEVQFNKQ